MENEPTFTPPGPFKFNSDDFVSEESNIVARYESARALFQKMENKAGLKKMQKLLGSIWNQGKSLKTNELISQIETQLNVDISKELE